MQLVSCLLRGHASFKSLGSAVYITACLFFQLHVDYTGFSSGCLSAELVSNVLAAIMAFSASDLRSALSILSDRNFKSA